MPEPKKPQTSTLGNLGQLIYNQYIKARGSIADTFRDEGPLDSAIRGGGSMSGGKADPHSYGMHTSIAKGVMEAFAPYIGDNTAIGGIRAAGTANEGLAGLLAAIKGQPILDSRGFDVGDLMANERGIDAYLNRNRPKPRPFTNVPATMSAR